MTASVFHMFFLETPESKHVRNFAGIREIQDEYRETVYQFCIFAKFAVFFCFANIGGGKKG